MGKKQKNNKNRIPPTPQVEADIFETVETAEPIEKVEAVEAEAVKTVEKVETKAVEKTETVEVLENAEKAETVELKTAKSEEKVKAASREENRGFTKEAKNLIYKISSYIKKTSAFLFEKYKRWLYNEETEKIVPRVKDGVSRWAAALACAVLFCTFGLYYLGFFEVGFIDRPEAWQDNRGQLNILLYGEEEEEPEAPEDTKVEDDKVYVPSTSVQSVDIGHTLIKDREEGKITYNTVFKTSEELGAEGYKLTNMEYDEDTCEVGLMTYSFGMPAKFSTGKMLIRDWVITEYEDGRESEVTECETEVERPSIYLYMGYIIYDDAKGGVYLCDSVGNVLMKYDESYIPAMARTKEGKPLFYKTYTYTAGAATAETVNEIGDSVATQFKNVKLTGKKYYTVSDNGKKFDETDYIEERDGRGLNFDFTADYGLSDCDIHRMGIISPKLTTFLNKSYALVNYMNWNFYREKDKDIPNIADIVAEINEYNALPIEKKKAAMEVGITPDDTFNVEERLPYTHAYNYNEDYAVVVTKDTGEDVKYETEEVRVLNNIGATMFASKKEYYNSHLKNYVSDRFLLPLSKGEDSIGHLYFDHGLLRLRKVCYDNFQLKEYGVFRVNTDNDVLVYPNGKEFPIPEGYNLKGYSDGVMVLERGGLYGYMDYTGRWIADPEYVNAEAFHGGVGVLTMKNGNVCAVNVNGGYVLPPVYDYIQNRSDGLIAAYSSAKGWEIYGIFSK